MNLIDAIRDWLLELLSGVDEATVSFPTSLCISLLGSLLILKVAFDSGVRSRPQLWIAAIVGAYLGSLLPAGELVLDYLRPWAQMPVFLICSALALWLPSEMVKYLGPSNHERRILYRWVYGVLGVLFIINLLAF